MLFKPKRNNPNKPNRIHAKRRGVFLSTELQLVLAFLGVMVVGYATTMGDSGAEKLVDDAEKALLQASDELRRTVGGFGSYASVDNTDCYDKNIWPSSWLSATQDEFTTPFSDNGLTCGSVDTATNRDGITSTGTGKFYTFTFSNVETDQCNLLVGRVFQNFVEIQVEGTRIDGNDTLKTQCASGDEVAITFINR
ncbi:hypothetical protein J0674_20745 [Vibrio parahaemolyticus]|uniref:hypothetical protein n=1 Tax=Vibrio TaxID=662 RepID=UPI000A3CED45|nr:MULTISPECIES: hypothetical protein [Vibrio]EJG1066179.1 hypothetical protein [Vibrio parahaemolyticus O1]MBE8572606.1 hypothetical protein [Vibrio sp. OPT46]MBO0174649.1 hypothetical protein [Vibrio parahaemolyticus]MCC9652187.1 hypothetical protein [Vibrio sp. MA64]OUD49895.1 hypothetical protein BTA15_20075 [Vibrio parahaemolyticus]